MPANCNGRYTEWPSKRAHAAEGEMIGELDAGNPPVRFDEGVQETCGDAARLCPTLRRQPSCGGNPPAPAFPGGETGKGRWNALLPQAISALSGAAAKANPRALSAI